MRHHLLCTTLIAVFLGGCVSSPLGRKQLQLFPDAQLAEVGAAAYREIKQKTKTSTDTGARRLVTCVADHLTRQLGGGVAWEVTVFEDKTANAFALPGGKLGVNTGLLAVAKDQHQLATVISHEIAHVLARHANERVSTAYVTQAGLQLVETLSGSASPAKGELLGLLGVGAQFGILMPYGRAQESEADLVGLDLMANAGFDPRASIALWENMQQAGGRGPPEFLSTHPAPGTRIADLSARMPETLSRYEQARASGKQPRCG